MSEGGWRGGAARSEKRLGGGAAQAPGEAGDAAQHRSDIRGEARRRVAAPGMPAASCRLRRAALSARLWARASRAERALPLRLRLGGGRRHAHALAVKPAVAAVALDPELAAPGRRVERWEAGCGRRASGRGRALQAAAAGASGRGPHQAAGSSAAQRPSSLPSSSPPPPLTGTCGRTGGRGRPRRCRCPRYPTGPHHPCPARAGHQGRGAGEARCKRCPVRCWGSPSAHHCCGTLHTAPRAPPKYDHPQQGARAH